MSDMFAEANKEFQQALHKYSNFIREHGLPEKADTLEQRGDQLFATLRKKISQNPRTSTITSIRTNIVDTGFNVGMLNVATQLFDESYSFVQMLLENGHDSLAQETLEEDVDARIGYLSKFIAAAQRGANQTGSGASR